MSVGESSGSTTSLYAVSDDNLHEQSVVCVFCSLTEHRWVRLQPEFGKTDSLRESILETPSVEHVFTTAEGEIVAVATPSRTTVGNWAQQYLPLTDVRRYDVQLLSSTAHSAYAEGTESALKCANCGTTVGEDGLATRVGGSLQQFCSENCETTYREQYTESQEKSDA